MTKPTFLNVQVIKYPKLVGVHHIIFLKISSSDLQFTKCWHVKVLESNPMRLNKALPLTCCAPLDKSAFLSLSPSSVNEVKNGTFLGQV